MNRLQKSAALALCLIFIAIPIYLFVVHPTHLVFAPGLQWLESVNTVGLIYVFFSATVGIWAYVGLRNAQTPTHRRILMSVLLDIFAIWAIDVLVWMKPNSAEAFGPTTTILSYFLAFLVLWAFLIDPRTKQALSRRSEPKFK